MLERELKMAKRTNHEKYQIIKKCCETRFKGKIFYLSIGMHNIDLYHRIAEKLGIKDNPKVDITSLTKRINTMMRKLIKEGYPIKEERKIYKKKANERSHVSFAWIEN